MARKIPADAPFHEGDVVCVYNTNMSGKPLYEGQAFIVGPGEVSDQYKVKFLNSDDRRCTFLRFVFPGECQDDPPAWMAKCTAEYEARKAKSS